MEESRARSVSVTYCASDVIRRAAPHAATRRKLGPGLRVRDTTRGRVPVALIGPTTWSNLQIFSAPITLSSSPRHSPPRQKTLRGVQMRVSADGWMDGTDRFFSLSLSLWSSFSRPLARTPVPTRLRDPERESHGRAVEISAAPPHPTRWFSLRSQLPQEDALRGNSRGICSCRNRCHIPGGTVTLDVALWSVLSSAPPGSRRTGGRCDCIRALQRCMRGTDGRMPGFTCHHKTKCTLFQNTTSARLKGRAASNSGALVRF